MPESFARVSKYPRSKEYYPEAVVSNLEIQAQFSKFKKKQFQWIIQNPNTNYYLVIKDKNSFVGASVESFRVFLPMLFMRRYARHWSVFLSSVFFIIVDFYSCFFITSFILHVFQNHFSLFRELPPCLS